MIGVFVFLPIAVNLFLIQHKESKRYLCGKDNQLFGLVSKSTKHESYLSFLFLIQTERNEHQCVFETKRSDIDFGRWDSYRLFYEEPNRGYLSISHLCHTRLRRKFDNDNYLNFLAFVRINTDISLETAAARRIVDQHNDGHRQRSKNVNPTNNISPKLISDYRQRFRFSLSPITQTTTTTTATTTTSTTTRTMTTTTTTTTTIVTYKLMRRLTFSSTLPPFKSLIVHVHSPTYNLNVPLSTRRWRSRRTRRS